MVQSLYFFLYFFYIALDSFLLFSSDFSSRSAQCTLFYLNWVQVVFSFSVFEIFYLYCYGF